MSRSRKKSSHHGIARCKSEKQDKRFANRLFRRKVNVLVKQDDAFRDQYTDDGPLLADIKDNDWQDTRPYWVYPLLREVSNVWSFGKDGKCHFWPSDHPSLMRK